MIDTIKKPVDIHTVSEVLKLSQTGDQQVSSRNTFDLADLCTHGNINMWAKYKPFRSSIMFFRQDGDPTKSDRDDEMRRQNYGIEPPGTRDSSDIVSCINDVWTYLRPRGKNYTYNEPYRLSDFINYSHNDKPFAVAQESVTVNRYFDYTGKITLTKSRGRVSVYALKVSDFAIFDTYRNLAVLVTPASGGDVFVRVTERIGEEVVVTIADLNALPTYFREKQLTFAFLATNHEKTTSFTNVLANVWWLIMPNDGVNKAYGELVITSNFHHDKTCNGIANDASTPPLTSFTGFEQTGDDKRYYFYPTSQWRYSCYLDLTLTNTAESVTLIRRLFEVRAFQNLVTNGYTPTYEIPKMYVKGEEVEEVEVPASGNVTIRFMLPNNIFVTNVASGDAQGVVVENRHMTCRIEFFYNNIMSSAVFSQNIRIRDYA